ncbi:MAG: hypothetical protein C4539_00065 [Ignavibacteriales bacterium]|nr:MAG: hypothetical protein C4539_00065 [Ignavibacteriales bacterium]
MSDNDKKRLSMYENVISFLQENRDIISLNRSFYYSLSKLRKMVDEIKIRDKELSSDTLEKTVKTYNAKDELILSLVSITAALYNFARERNDITLKEKTRISQSFFVRLRDVELINRASGIYQIASLNFNALQKYKVTKELMHDLKAKLDRFSSALDTKVNSFITGDAAVALSNSFNEAESIINNQLDKLVEQFDSVFPEFYDDYLMIRSMENIEEGEEEEMEMENYEQ